MIGRRHPEPPAPQVGQPAPPAPPAVKRPAAEADCFKPSSFASRKAEATQRAGADARELVYMGQTAHWMKDRRGKDLYVDAELFFEHGHPNRRYVRLDGDPTFYPLFEQGRKDPVPEPIGAFSRKSVLPSRYPASSETQMISRP